MSNLKEFAEKWNKEVVKGNFENYLQMEFSDENPTILDDDQPDSFDDWIAELEPEQWFRMADQFARKKADHRLSEVRSLWKEYRDAPISGGIPTNPWEWKIATAISNLAKEMGWDK